ncbi:hypothetical protein MVES_001539 [Malassezia vespertilionis]|uniref:DH domain-containing protein n=1 Tax=Malassezia vespertilionis TaxID=2020962 RepID=A0A2N1JCM7_9BASI|nr:hypothetical protein MVES_001539 [Malassezia vespertilionis]
MVSHQCDIVLADVGQAQVLQLERFLQLLGPQVYSHRAHKENKAGSWASSMALSSPVAGENLTVFPHPEQKITRALELVLEELVVTERTYVKRIEALFNRYAVPLRQLAQDKDTEIIPVMEAERMFGNLGEIVAANKMLLCELEILYEQGAAYMAASIGEVMAQNMRRFACYDEYLSDFEQAKEIYNQMLKSKAFRGFIQRTQHSTNNLGNAGLRELMMEPLQRIPRYRLLMGNIMKNIPPSCVQYQRLHEASGLASHIASREVNSTTRRAAVLWSCQRNIERFPLELVNARRELLGCIDVEEPSESSGGVLNAIGSAFTRGKHSKGHMYSLLVFDDVLVVLQRFTTVPTHHVLRVQDIEKLADMMRASQVSSPNPNAKKHDLGFAGMVDLCELKAEGLDEKRIRCIFSAPLRGTSNRSETRVFTDSMSTLHGASRTAMFLECLWKAQAVHRARARALQVRAGVVPGNGQRAASMMLYTLYTPSQFQRFPYKGDFIVQIGSADTARQFQMDYNIDRCISVEMTGKENVGTVWISAKPGSDDTTYDLPLHYIPVLCAHMVENPYQPLALPAEAKRKATVAEDPVRRFKSIRVASRGSVRSLSRSSTRNSPGAQRARSLMSDRVRASIQSSLEAVIESNAEEEETQGMKRTNPLGEIGNTMPKRRTLSSLANGTENIPPGPALLPAEDDLVKEYARMDTHYDTPSKLAPTPVQEPAKEETRASPKPPRESVLRMPAEDTHRLKNPFDAQDAQTSADEAAEVENSLPPLPDSPMMDVDEEKLASRVSSATSARPSTHSRNASATSVMSKQVTEEEMQVMLKPILSQVQEIQASQAVSEEAPQIPMPQTAKIEGEPSFGDLEQDMDLTVLRLLKEEQAKNELVPPVPPLPAVSLPFPSEEKEQHKRPTQASSRVLDESRAMKQSIICLGEAVAGLRKHRPSSIAAQSDWALFKDALKDVNMCWTDMERAYEDKQMELAAVRLQGPPPKTDICAEEMARTVDQLHAQLAALEQRAALLAASEEDARLENTELYMVCNEELSKLYEHSFKPEHEETDFLRRSLVAAKTEVHNLRIENRALRYDALP